LLSKCNISIWGNPRKTGCTIDSVYSINNSTEVAIRKMIEASQRMITVNSQGEGMNPAIKRHYELQIKTLQNAHRDPDKLERLLKVKQRQKR
jgi:hypothetical protein